MPAEAMLNARAVIPIDFFTFFISFPPRINDFEVPVHYVGLFYQRSGKTGFFRQLRKPLTL
jgi:hypothetical protein